jgi:hypothetical protein
MEQHAVTSLIHNLLRESTKSKLESLRNEISPAILADQCEVAD